MPRFQPFLPGVWLMRQLRLPVKLGLLEVEPEDFAVCAFACPSKMDLMSIIRKGLDDVEKEGI